MVITLVSSTLVLQLRSNKNKPVPQWTENLILHRIAFVVGLKSVLHAQRERLQHDKFTRKGGNNKTSDLCKSLGSSDISIRVKSDFHSGNLSKVAPGHKFDHYSEANQNRWIQCAFVLKRVFLISWLVINLGSVGLIMFMALGNKHGWDDLK